MYDEEEESLPQFMSSCFSSNPNFYSLVRDEKK